MGGRRSRHQRLLVGVPLLVLCLAPQPALSEKNEPTLTLPDRAREALVELAAKNPFADIAKPAPGDERFSGRVSELMRAGSYTYLYVTLDDGNARWVVTMARGIELDASVTVSNMGTQKNFHSKRLDYSFDELVFGVVRPVKGGSR
jgi:hypothetical protein